MAAEKQLDALLKRYAQSIEGAMNVSAEAAPCQWMVEWLCCPEHPCEAEQ